MFAPQSLNSRFRISSVCPPICLLFQVFAPHRLGGKHSGCVSQNVSAGSPGPRGEIKTTRFLNLRVQAPKYTYRGGGENFVESILRALKEKLMRIQLVQPVESFYVGAGVKSNLLIRIFWSDTSNSELLSEIVIWIYLSGDHFFVPRISSKVAWGANTRARLKPNFQF